MGLTYHRVSSSVENWNRKLGEASLQLAEEDWLGDPLSTILKGLGGRKLGIAITLGSISTERLNFNTNYVIFIRVFEREDNEEDVTKRSISFAIINGCLTTQNTGKFVKFVGLDRKCFAVGVI
ncbi:hypothetical protein Zmor_005902 [Zophobas morio]|uniref:Uncharacterized protein n=1 Tax=Zophobas morio TaxID=2755281 RepID=A0AA38MN38_9CUCU|nr:hypothetical protein Zmor_005902 [Zophobas morio]